MVGYCLLPQAEFQHPFKTKQGPNSKTQDLPVNSPLSSSDPLDAKLIAHYDEAVKPRLSQLRPSLLQKMSDLLARRRQLLNMQTMEKNRCQIMAKNNIIQSMSGIGSMVVFSLISNMPELGYISNKEAPALVGIALMNRESGRYEGHRKYGADALR